MNRPWTCAALGLLAGLSLAAQAGEVSSFGKPLSGLKPSKLEEVLAKPEAGKRVRLEGTIASVCRSMGCWLELKQGERSVHVTFEGHSFFVPKDSIGKPCVLEGRVVIGEPSSEEVEHKRAEGAAAAGERLSIEAVGVLIRSAP